MKEILNNNDKDYANECFEKAIQIGLDFKLNNAFKEKKYNKENFAELLETPVSGIELKKLLSHFQTEILPYCSNTSSFISENIFPNSKLLNNDLSCFSIKSKKFF